MRPSFFTFAIKVGPDEPVLHEDLSVAVALLRQSHQVMLILHRQDPPASDVLVAIHPVLPRLTQAAIKGRPRITA